MFETVRVRVPAMPLPAAAEQSQSGHRAIESLVLMLFWMLLFEGVLRKWVAPAYSQYLFFVRDPFLLVLYWHAWRADAFRDAGPLLHAGLAFSVVAILLALVQSIGFGDSRLIAVLAYGWRQYFLYLPLPFAMAATLNRSFLLRFARHAFLAIILTAPLALLQANTSPSAVLNRGTADDESLQFQSFAYTGELIRPSGPFTSAVGMKEIIPSTFALLLAVWLTPPARRRIGPVMLLATAGAVATCLAVSGSRAAFMMVFVVVLSALALGLLTRVNAVRVRALLIPLTLLGLGAVLYPLLFPDAFAAMINRVTEAHAVESRYSSLGIVGRALYEYVDFTSYLGTTPLAGLGLGLGGNGRTFVASSDSVAVGNIFAESDWSRHIVDLGTVVGVLFILYRLVFAGTLLARTLRATRASDSPFPLLLFGYVGLGLCNGQLTGHGTTGGFLWLYLGLCMASCRIEERA